MSPFLIHLTMMPSTEVSRFHTLFADSQRATAATKPPRADAAAVPPCCYRVLTAASGWPLATAYIAEHLVTIFGEPCKCELRIRATSSQLGELCAALARHYNEGESTPLLRRKSTTFGPSSGLPASMRYLSPPACTSTPSPWPTSMKLTDNEPEGGGPGPPPEPSKSRSSSAQAGASTSKSGARRYVRRAIKRVIGSYWENLDPAVPVSVRKSYIVPHSQIHPLLGSTTQ